MLTEKVYMTRVIITWALVLQVFLNDATCESISYNVCEKHEGNIQYQKEEISTQDHAWNFLTNCSKTNSALILYFSQIEIEKNFASLLLQGHNIDEAGSGSCFVLQQKYAKCSKAFELTKICQYTFWLYNNVSYVHLKIERDLISRVEFEVNYKFVSCNEEVTKNMTSCDTSVNSTLTNCSVTSSENMTSCDTSVNSTLTNCSVTSSENSTTCDKFERARNISIGISIVLCICIIILVIILIWKIRNKCCFEHNQSKVLENAAHSNPIDNMEMERGEVYSQITFGQNDPTGKGSSTGNNQEQCQETVVNQIYYMS